VVAGTIAIAVAGRPLYDLSVRARRDAGRPRPVHRGGARMIRRIAAIVALTLVWLALWEEASLANMVTGVLLATVVLGLFRDAPAEAPGTIRPVAALHFVAYFVWKLVEASAVVAWEVLTPKNKINEGIVAVPIHGASHALTTAVANAISLVPGTLTIEVDEDPAVLYVHVLHLRDIEAVRHEVQHLEALAVRAFGSAAAVAALEADLPTSAIVEPTQATDAVREERS
jgi:multicomponent Na+:H+ antiporter subunit E